MKLNKLVYEFLNAEFQKNPKLQEGLNKLNKTSPKSDPDNSKIYEFKLESKKIFY